MCNGKETAHKNASLWVREYSYEQCNPNLPANHSCMYKPIPNFRYYSSRPYHMVLYQNRNIRLEFWASDRLPYRKAYSDQVSFPSGCCQMYKPHFRLYELCSTQLQSWLYLSDILGLSREPLQALCFKSILKKSSSWIFFSKNQPPFSASDRLLYGRDRHVFLNFATFPVTAFQTVQCWTASVLVL